MEDEGEFHEIPEEIKKPEFNDLSVADFKKGLDESIENAKRMNLENFIEFQGQVLVNHAVFLKSVLQTLEKADMLKEHKEREKKLAEKYHREFLKKFEEIELQQLAHQYRWSPAELLMHRGLKKTPRFFSKIFYERPNCRGDILPLRGLRKILRRESVWFNSLFLLAILFTLGGAAIHYSGSLPKHGEFHVERQIERGQTVQNVWSPWRGSDERLEWVLKVPWISWTLQDSKRGYLEIPAFGKQANVTLKSLDETLEFNKGEFNCTCAPILGMPVRAVWCDNVLLVSPHIRRKSDGGRIIEYDNPLLRAAARMGFKTTNTSMFVPNQAEISFIQRDGTEIVQVFTGKIPMCVTTCLSVTQFV